MSIHTCANKTHGIPQPKMPHLT